MVGEAVGIFEDSATDHEAVCLGVFFVEGEGGGFGFDVAVDDEFGLGADLFTKFENIWDEFVVGGDFAHFFFGTEVDSQGGGVLV